MLSSSKRFQNKNWIVTVKSGDTTMIFVVLPFLVLGGESMH